MSSSARELSSDPTPPHPSPKEQLIASLERLVQNFPPDSLQPHGGFYYGPASIALLFFALSKHYADDLRISNKHLSAWFTAYFSSLPDPLRSGSGGSGGSDHPSSNHCGVMEDLLSTLALQAGAYSDKRAAVKLCDLATVADTPGISDEWLYGRAGYLYLLRLAKSGFAPNNGLEILDRIEYTAQLVILAIHRSPQPWSWHGKVYLGAVHGVIGIITQIVLTVPSCAAGRLEQLLDSLLRTQSEDSGNWPSSLPAGRRDRLVQVCHGAPGVVVSLLAIRKYFPGLETRIDEAVARGRSLIKERGLLPAKEPCLCHGVSGNALALAEADLDAFLAHATEERMGQLIDAGVMEPSSHPEGLWTGEAGRAWAWAVADKGLERGLLGYNDL